MAKIIHSTKSTGYAKSVAMTLLLCSLLFACGARRVETGLDRVLEYRHLFAQMRVGIITNHTAYDARNRHITEVFNALEGAKVTALFGPEHGVRGHAEAGAHVESEVGAADRIPVFSLYGKTRKPTPEMLANVDVLVFDIQDIGTRYYTYIYTMALAMEAAAEQGKSFVVLDRPNPINGIDVEGNILDLAFATFVGLYPIPVRHGMTVGELARMFNSQGWLTDGVRAELTIIPMKNWRREFWYDKTGREFPKPSPNMPALTTATVYPGTCLLEGVNVSEGRGTQTPFEIFGAPWIDGEQLTERLNSRQLAGVVFRDTVFTPVAIPGAAENPKYKGKVCGGSFIEVTDRAAFQPYWTGVEIVNTVFEMYPDSLRWRPSHFDRLCGTARTRETIAAGDDISSFPEQWQPALNEFKMIRARYLMYD